MPKEQNTEKPKTEDKLNGNGKKGKVILGASTSYEVRQGIVKEIIVHSSLEAKLLDLPKETEKIVEEPKTKIVLNEKAFEKKEPEKEAKLTLLIIPSEEYRKNINFLSKYLSEKYGMVLYVSLNEIYSTIVLTFKENKIDLDKFYFVDAITSSAELNPQKKDNCTFVVSPNTLVELSLAISSAIENKNVKALLFDSISTMLIYESQTTVVKFIHSLIGKIKAAHVDAFFTSLEGDSQTQAIKDLGMFVDDFVTIDKFRMYRVELGVFPEDLLSEKPFKPRKEF